MQIRIFLSVISIFLFITSHAQEEGIKTAKTKSGSVQFYWGWNRGYYTPSNIRFTGSNYDFTLSKVRAKDRQSKFGYDPYFHPLRVTIPQTNFGLGYFIANKTSVFFAVDHMKYVMVADQVVNISGYIRGESNLYDGTYENDSIQLAFKFLSFEHTDGLNFIHGQINRSGNLLNLLKVNPDKLQLNITAGVGIGVLMPKSNVKLMNNERYDEFHLAGFGVATKLAADLTIFKVFFVSTELKSGYISMPSIRVSPDNTDMAAQSFGYLQYNFLFGGRVYL